MFADAHLHMTDPEFDDGYDDISDAALLFSNTARPSEYERLGAMRRHDCRIVPFYGTHPWYSDEYRKDALEEIVKRDTDANIGEIGLDSKRGDVEKQMPVFLSQLEIASRYGRIASIHAVGCENEILNALREYRIRAILHSFSGPVSYVKPFRECGCWFSVSPRIFSKSPDKVVSILKAIPANRLLLETDAPGNHNNCILMSEHAENVANALGIPFREVADTTLRNACTLLGRDIPL